MQRLSIGRVLFLGVLSSLILWMPLASQSNPSTHGADLSGYWGRLLREGAKEGGGTGDIQFQSGGEHLKGTVEGFQKWLTAFEKDLQIAIRAQTNRPPYKPEFWDKIRAGDWDHSRKKDPSSHCLPAVPRLGAPQRIVQIPGEVIMFYEYLNRFRIIPTDNRPHDPTKASIPTWFGDSVGHWEDDTLVVDTIGLIDNSWIGPSAYVHSPEMRVTERFRRAGDTLTISTTVEDPMLLQPWQMDPITVKRNTDPKAQLWEEAPCDERDKEFVGDPHEGR
jgi:hypothetical protein